MSGRLEVSWRAREPPLAPSAVFALGAAAAVLVRRLLARGDEGLAQLRGVASAPGPHASYTQRFVLLLGDAALLPWADGAVYLGCDPAAPSLLVPTTLAPSVPVELLERALLVGHSGALPPIAVLPAPHALLVPCGDARPLSRARLADAA